MPTAPTKMIWAILIQKQTQKSQVRFDFRILILTNTFAM